MSISTYLKGTAVAVAGALTALPAQAETMMVGHGFSPTHFFAKDLTEPWMTCVTEATNDELSFQYFPSGQISNANATLDALNTGLLQVASVSIGYVTNKMPLNGVSMLPNLGESSAQMVAAYRRALDEIQPLADEMSANRIHPLVVTMFPPYQVQGSGEPIDTLEKFDGHLVRSAGSANTLTIQHLGAVGVEMPGADIYVSLERGTIDAVLMGVSSLKAYSLQELLKSISSNGQFGTFLTLLAMDEAQWQKLSPETQQAVTDCSLRVEADVAGLLDKEHEELLAEFAGQGITVFEFSDEELEKMKQALVAVGDEFVDRLGARGLPAAEVRTAYEKIVTETPVAAGE